MAKNILITGGAGFGNPLIFACQGIPWIQANLILTNKDDGGQISTWQEHLKSKGIWVSEPVPMFPFPGSRLYQQTFSAPPR